MAQKVGGENRLAWIQKRHWEKLAAEIGIKPKVVMEYCASLAERLPGLSVRLAAEMEPRHGTSPVLSRIVERIETSSKRLLSRIED